jgi:TRAP transporter 4TM/12TM fusion protein
MTKQPTLKYLVRLLTLKNIVSLITISGSVYFWLGVSYEFITSDLHKNLFIAYSLVLSFLITIESNKTFSVRNIVSILAIILSIAVAVYVQVNYFEIIFRVGKSTTMDTVAGLILIILGLEATRRLWGNIIAGIVIMSLAYGYFGNLLPGSWFHTGIPLHRLVGYSTLYMQGMYGTLTMITSVIVFAFILFGSILDAAGGGQCLINIAQNVSKKMRSGAAQVAIIGSALMGTISGNIAANVATTGAVTIPTMIKSGIRKEFAAAVEATASTGGQIMPPVMGVAAFLIVGLTGIPYIEVCKASLLPALLFYFYLSLSMQIRATKMHWVSKSVVEGVAWIPTLKQYFHLLVPFGVIVYYLARKYPPSMAAYYAINAMIILVVIRIFLGNLSNPKVAIKTTLHVLGKGFFNGGLLTAKLGVSVAVLGILVEVFVVTGFAQTIAIIMVEYSRGSLFLLLCLTSIVCILFGMEMTTAAAYLIVATLAAPALIEAGLSVLHSHLFVFYYGLLSSVTPPVARGVMVATTMIGDEKAFWRVAKYALRLSLPVFILPFLWAFRPELLWTNTTPILQTIYNSFIVVVGSIAIISMFENFMFVKLRFWEWPLLIVCALCLFIPSRMTVDAVGLMLLAIVFFAQFRSYKRATSEPEAKQK